MVVAANQTPRKLLGESLNMLDPAKVLGIVFNRDERPLFGYYNSYYREYFPEPSQFAQRGVKDTSHETPMVPRLHHGRFRTAAPLRMAARVRRHGTSSSCRHCC